MIIFRIVFCFLVFGGPVFANSGGSISSPCAISGSSYVVGLAYTGVGFGAPATRNQIINFSCNETNKVASVSLDVEYVDMICRCDAGFAVIAWQSVFTGLTLAPVIVTDLGMQIKPFQQNTQVFSFLAGMLCASAFVSASLARLF